MPLCNATDMPTSVMVLFYEKLTVRLSMRKTQMNPPKGGCASETKWTNWNSINWNKVSRAVKSLQARIVKAVKAKHFHKAKALLLLLTRSFYGKLLAILRVTTNKGSKTCGVNKILWNTHYVNVNRQYGFLKQTSKDVSITFIFKRVSTSLVSTCASTNRNALPNLKRIR